MPTPVNSRNRAVFLLLVAAAALATGLLLPSAGQKISLQLFLFLGGLSGAIFAGVWLILQIDSAGRFKRLRRGEGIVARWTVGPARWEWFKEESLKWDKQGDLGVNKVDVRQAVPKNGVEIVIADDCVLIGSDFHAVDRQVSVRAHPEWIELIEDIPNPDGPSRRIVLRFPLAPGQESAAEIVRHHYEQALAQAFSKVSRSSAKLYLFLFLSVGLPLATLLIVWLVRRGG